MSGLVASLQKRLDAAKAKEEKRQRVVKLKAELKTLTARQKKPKGK